MNQFMRFLLLLFFPLAMLLPAQQNTTPRDSRESLPSCVSALARKTPAPQENPLIPMSAVTGRPSREFISQFMGEFRRVGITQFLLYPRSGCELEYLSEEWFQAIQNVLDAAEAHGYTSIWLYDEFNWPSGQCAGRVMQAREAFAVQCLYARKNSQPRASREALLSCVSPLGRKKQPSEITFELKSLKQFPNLLNPEAVELFIQLTHEEYYKRFGKYFGTLIKGIFSDEPSVAYYYEQYEGDSDTEVRLAWYPELEEEYRELTGHELKEDLRAHLQGTAPFCYRVPYQKLMGARFRKTYFDTIRTWCENHGILLTGHLMNELDCQAARYNGDPLLANAGFSMPGMDEIFTNTNPDAIEWQTLGTVEYGSRQRGCGLAELFALGPGDMQPGSYKQMIWLTALFGVDHYLLAVSQFQAEGNLHKTMWFNPTSPAQTWFDHYDQLGETAKEAARFARKPWNKVEVEIRYAEDFSNQPYYLRLMTRYQRSWRFIHKDDAASKDALAVVTFQKDGSIYDEISKKTFFDMAAFMLYLDINYCQPFRVMNSRDTLARDVMLRYYDDGTCVALDLREPDAPTRRLHFRIGPNPDRDIIFNLPAGDIKIFHDTDQPSADFVEYALDLPDAPWEIVLDRKNILCPEYDAEGTLRLTVAKDTPCPKALIRAYGVPGAVRMDGTPISASNPGEGLPQGVAPLYRTSETIDLESGRHTLALDGKKTEYPYLPSAFLLGNFAVKMVRPGEMTIGPLPKSVRLGPLSEQGFRNFIGKATLTRTVNIPETADALRLETAGHCASVAINGQNLGCRLWAPFDWDIPTDIKGKDTTLQITLEIPIATLFGKERLHGQIIAPAHDIHPAGLYAAKWVERR